MPDELFYCVVKADTALRIFRELLGQGVYFAANPNPMNPDQVEVVVEQENAELVAPFLLGSDK